MMALQDEIKAVGQVFSSMVRDWSTHKGFRYMRMLLYAVGIGLLVAGGYAGYRWLTISRSQTAQKAFSEYMQDYYLALKDDNPQEWDRVGALFQFGRNTYRSSALAPYFLVMQSEVELQQGKREQAAETLSLALQEISDPSMKALFSTKRALMKLDSDTAVVREQGEHELVQLARESSNPYHDMALFYLGRFYLSSHQPQEAKKIWQELVDSSWIDKMNPSVWVHEAKAALSQLN